MERKVFINIVGLDKEVIDEIEEYVQECAREKKELETKIGHEVDEDTFYLIKMFEEHEYKKENVRKKKELNVDLFYLIEKFREEEYEKGRAEGEKKVIFNMFAKGFDDKFISKYSSDSVEEVAALRKEWLEKVSSENAD